MCLDIYMNLQYVYFLQYPRILKLYLKLSSLVLRKFKIGIKASGSRSIKICKNEIQIQQLQYDTRENYLKDNYLSLPGKF